MPLKQASRQLAFIGVHPWLLDPNGSRTRTNVSGRLRTSAVASQHFLTIQGFNDLKPPVGRQRKVNVTKRRLRKVSFFEIYTPGVSNAPFPLTPALSPKGEGEASPDCRTSERGRWVETRQRWSPLPWGEGQGEGKGSIQHPRSVGYAAGPSVMLCASCRPRTRSCDTFALPPWPTGEEPRRTRAK